MSLPGFKTPEQVREYMERADIFLFTSDRQEGWGAVANEDGRSGLIYKDGDREQLFGLAERLVRDRELCRELGRNAYRRITELWNPEDAAKRLALLCVKLGLLKPAELEPEESERKGRETDREGAPCTPAPVMGERYRRLPFQSR